MTEHTDRISKYLIKLNESMLFDELSREYLESSNLAGLLEGVPVPIAPAGAGATGNMAFSESGENIISTGDGENIASSGVISADTGEEAVMTTLSIALAMARVIGADNNFPYKDAYLAYFEKAIGADFVKVLVSEGAKAAQYEDFETACMYFRAALLIDPQNLDALYLYGRACGDAYDDETKDEDYVGSFKAESLEVFEILTMMHPEFAMGYYFLGYGYANLGLYTKAALTWNTFMELTEAGDDAADESGEAYERRTEIAERLEQLEEPVNIERGVNAVLSGDFQGGKEILETYKDGAYAAWWPLWYYLANAEVGLANGEEAIRGYQMALSYSPSNIDVMEELAAVCEAMGDTEKAEKYRTKIDVVRSNLESEELL